MLLNFSLLKFISIRVLRTDNVLEYVKKDVSIFYSKNEIIHQSSYSHTSHQSSCSHTSQQNGVAERKYKHILDIARIMMIHMSILKYLWSDAVLSCLSSD